MVQWFKGTIVQRDNCSKVQRDKGTKGQWDKGTMGQRYNVYSV